MSAIPKLAALAVLVRMDQVLLVKRKYEPDAGEWGFPGGHVELGETALESAVRELREETGVVARPSRYLTNVDLIRHDGDGKVQYHFLLAAVVCDYVGGEPVANDDVSDAMWFSLKEVLGGKVNCSEHVAEVLRDPAP